MARAWYRVGTKRRSCHPGRKQRRPGTPREQAAPPTAWVPSNITQFELNPCHKSQEYKYSAYDVAYVKNLKGPLTLSYKNLRKNIVLRKYISVIMFLAVELVLNTHLIISVIIIALWIYRKNIHCIYFSPLIY